MRERINLTKLCRIRWTESVYTPYVEGSVSDFIGERTVTGLVVDEGYSARSGKHFFTIIADSCEGVNSHEILPKSKIVRRGVAVYPKLQILEYPENYQDLVDEKMSRKR
jgi:hypothetical protein